MRMLLLVLFSVLASAQTIAFAPQATSRIPGLREFRVYIGAPAGQPLQVQGMRVMLEAAKQEIRVYSYVNLQRYVDEYNKRSWTRWVGVGLEIAGWALTSGTAMETIKIKEKWVKAGTATVSAVLTFTRTLYDREYRPLSLPSDLMPPLIAVPAGGSVDYAVFCP